MTEAGMVTRNDERAADDAARSAARTAREAPDAGAEAETARAAPEAQSEAVSEARTDRRRAQAAEQRLAALRAQLDGAQRTLEAQREALEDLACSRRIDELLVQSDVVDLEAARLLAEAALGETEAADPVEIVDALRRSRPYLFRGGVAGSGVLSPRVEVAGGARDELADAGAAASASGRRQDLLRYLRLRRGR